MMAVGKLHLLAEVTAHQWGMVTSAQASALGVTRLDLSRLADAGHLARLAHGVYMDAGAPGDEFDDLRAAWLSTDPARLADQRLMSRETDVVVAGESAARLHRIGDFRAQRHDFVATVRRQSQRPEIRYRRRVLDPRDVTRVEGLPVMTIERTIADLVEDLRDLSLAADALRSASSTRILDTSRLKQLLVPFAARNALPNGDGTALLDRLSEIAGLDNRTLARRVAADGVLGPLVAANYLQNLSADSIRSAMELPDLKELVGAAIQPIVESFRKSALPPPRDSKRASAELLADLELRNLVGEVTVHVLRSLAVDPRLESEHAAVVRDTRQALAGKP